MGQFVPGPREGIGKLVRIFQKAPREFFLGRIDSQRKVGRQHRRAVSLGGVVRIRDDRIAALGYPLMRASWAFCQFPLEAE